MIEGENIMKKSSVNQDLVRLQKFIADSGLTSRRKAEDLIVDARVRVNGRIITELGTKVSIGEDVVEVDGQIIEVMGKHDLYIVFHKPRSVMTTLSDPEGRKTIMDFFKAIKQRIYPIGRLDYLSEGLLLMTNDGDLAQKIMHPSYQIEKTYEVKVFGRVSEATLKKMRKGIEVDGDFLKPHNLRVIELLPGKTWLEFRLREGKNREIRRICEAHGLVVDKLKRVAIGGLSIDHVAPGNWYTLTQKELLTSIGIDAKGKPLKNAKPYLSQKKSISLKTKKAFKIQKTAVDATDEKFQFLKRDVYFQNLQQAADLKEVIKKEKEDTALNMSQSFAKDNQNKLKEKRTPKRF